MYGTPQFAQRGPGTYLTGAPLSRSPRRRLRRFSGFGSLTPDQATEQIFPAAQVRSGAGHNQSIRDQILQSANAGQILNAQGSPAYMPGTGQCSGASLLKPAITGTVGSLALHFAPQAFAAGPIVGGIVVGIAAISELFTVIFGHHAAAIKKEQSVLCAATPAANQSLQLIDQAVQQGQATPQDAITALGNVVSGFQQAVASIIHGANPMSSGECNAACVILSELRAIVLLKQSQYQDLAAQQSTNPVGAALAPVTAAFAPVSQAVQSVQAAAASAGLPAWLVPAAGFFLLWKLL